MKLEPEDWRGCPLVAGFFDGKPEVAAVWPIASAKAAGVTVDTREFVNKILAATFVGDFFEDVLPELAHGGLEILLEVGLVCFKPRLFIVEAEVAHEVDGFW